MWSVMWSLSVKCNNVGTSFGPTHGTRPIMAGGLVQPPPDWTDRLFLTPDMTRILRNATWLPPRGPRFMAQ
jgi:hypothetical protein